MTAFQSGGVKAGTPLSRAAGRGGPMGPHDDLWHTGEGTSVPGPEAARDVGQAMAKNPAGADHPLPQGPGGGFSAPGGSTISLPKSCLSSEVAPQSRRSCDWHRLQGAFDAPKLPRSDASE